MFENFFNSTSLIVVDTAKKLEMYKNQLDQHLISTEEFKDLSNNLLNLNTIINLTNDINEQEIITKAYKLMLQIISSLPTTF